MIKPELIEELKTKLDCYRRDFSTSGDAEVLEGSRMIAVTVERLINALESQDSHQASLEAFTFSRQCSDAYFKHLGSLADLSNSIQKVRSELK